MQKMILAVAAGLAVAGAALMWTGNSGPDPLTALPPGAVSAQEAAEVDTSGIVEMTMGPADAKVTVVEYASFTCPHCARFHETTFQKLKSEYIDNNLVHFVYRDVYFDRFGLWAAMIARCDGSKRFFGISDMIYTQQRDWIAGGNDPVEIANNLRKIGKVAGLPDDQLEACLADTAKAKALVAWYQKNSETDDVNSTPTLIINGKKHSNMSFEDLKVIIDQELNS